MAAERKVREQINVLQAGRAIAALAVLFHHAAASAEFFSGPLPGWVAAAAGYGYLGVDFFFVLSGFIIYHVNRDAQPGLAWVRRYSWSRLTRVFLPYLPVGIALALAYTLFPGLSAGSREWNWFSTLTLLPSGADPSLIVAWTLTHELIFYAVFALAFAVGRPFLVVGLWVAAILARNFLFGPVERFESNFLGLINIEFFFGMATAWIVAKGWRLPAVIASVAAFAVYAALGAGPEHRVLFGLSVAFLLIALVQAEAGRRLSVPLFLVVLGNASYAIYLVHAPLVSVFARVLDNPVLSLAGTSLAGIGAGLIYHFVYERPGLKLINRRSRRAPQAKEALTPP